MTSLIHNRLATNANWTDKKKIDNFTHFRQYTRMYEVHNKKGFLKLRKIRFNARTNNPCKSNHLQDECRYLNN